MYDLQLVSLESDRYPEPLHIVKSAVIPRTDEFLHVDGIEYIVEHVDYHFGALGVIVRLGVRDITDDSVELAPQQKLRRIADLLNGDSLRLAAAVRVRTDQGNFIRLHVEDMKNPNVLGITVEIPEEVAAEYDLEGEEITEAVAAAT